VLDAVEESIRDIMECFLTADNVKKVTESDDSTENKQPQTLPEDNIYGDMEIQTIPNDSEAIPQVIEDELRALVLRKQSEKHLEKKFMYLNKILTQFANSTRYIEKVRLWRLYLFLVIAIGK